ncbi:MAG: response regulator, partial [Candidatus Cryptobacteroides sp.]
RPIYYLFIDDGNSICALTDDGIVKLDLDTGEYCFKENSTEDEILYIMPIGEGRIWALTRHGAVILSGDLLGKEAVEIPFTPSNVFKGYNGEIWLSSPDGNIYRYDQKRKTFTGIEIFDKKSLLEGKRISLIRPVDSRFVIVSDSETCIYLVNTDRETVNCILDIQDIIDGALLQDMLSIDPGELWFATDKGLIVYDRNNDKAVTYLSNPAIPLSLCGSNLRRLYKDDFGRIWIGSFYQGLSCLESSPFRFYTGSMDKKGSSLRGKTVRAFVEDMTGCIWMACEDGCIVCIDSNGKSVTYGDDGVFPHEGNYQAIALYKSNIIVGSYGDGILVINPVTHRIIKRYNAGNNNVVVLLITKDNTVYAGTSDGLYRLDSTSDSFLPVEGGEGFVHALCQDRTGRIWVGYYRGYLKLLETDGVTINNVVASSQEMNPSYTRATSLFEDQSGDIWMTTEGKGVYKIDPVPGQDGKYNMVNIRKSDGLPSDVTCAMNQSFDGRLWLSTMRGIVSMNQDGGILGINRLSKVGNFFRYGASLLSNDGRIYMGTSEGALSFNPEDLTDVVHKLFISSITYGHNDSSYFITEPGHSSLTTGKIRIKSKDASYIRIKLASVAPVSDNGLEYYFRLENNGRANETISENPFITYANLTPGNYLFTAGIKGQGDSADSPAIQLRIVPPFMLCKGMKALYFILLMAGLVGCALLVYKSLKRKAKEAERVLEENMQKEMYESKINFFTGISHEIRTHLTLIKLSIDSLFRAHPEEGLDYEDVQTNIDKLIDYANLVLDVRKVDSGKMALNYVVTDVSLLFREVCHSYISLAETYSINFSFDTVEGSILSHCASSSIEKILNNLLMNGIKYCSSKVYARLSVDGDEIVISVFSDGEPISPHDRTMIFKPFYQSKNSKSNISSFHGSGLGLPLSKSLAEMQGGSLILDKDNVDGNTFILTIPYRKVEYQEGKPRLEHESATEAESPADGRKTILVVEDDIKLNNYIGKCFSEDYAVLQAGNGIEALDLLSKHPVDLILSDIKMPEMDGCELCNKVKNTLEYSHIAVILITAVTDNETQMTTLRSGADAFITKPFSMELLTATVDNIFKNREIIASKFATQPMYDVPDASGSHLEDKFMKNLYNYIIENCSNPDMLSVSRIAEHMCVSRSTLFRKVKAKANTNVNEFVMACRLRKSAELLSTREYRINEVASYVGITSSSYFAKLFQKQFGISPSAFMESLPKIGEDSHPEAL